MGAVLNVVGRPEAQGGGVVPFVEQGVECLKDKRLILLLYQGTHFVSSNSVAIVLADASFGPGSSHSGLLLLSNPLTTENTCRRPPAAWATPGCECVGAAAPTAGCALSPGSPATSRCRR